MLTFELNQTGVNSAYGLIEAKAYLDNAELAKDLYDFISKLRSCASTKGGVDAWLAGVLKIVGISLPFEIAKVVNLMSFNIKVLRLEFDEEYAEMQFMDAEDRGW